MMLLKLYFTMNIIVKIYVIGGSSMKKVRSLLCILLALSMVLLFCACAKDGGTEDTPDTTGKPATAAPTEKPEEKPEE